MNVRGKWIHHEWYNINLWFKFLPKDGKLWWRWFNIEKDNQINI